MRITIEAWRTALARLQHERQAELGPPEQITNEQLAAYCEGKLSGAEMSRVREFVVAYPDLTDLVLAIHDSLSVPFSLDK